MKLVIRTDAKNIEDLIRRYKLYLEGTTNKMCMVNGGQHKIKSLKDDLDAIKIAYFDYEDNDQPSAKEEVKPKKKKN